MRRFGATFPALAAVLSLGAVPAAGQQPYPLRALTIEFGIKDHQSTVWDGSLSLSAGEVVELRGHHFTEQARIGPGHSWVASTTEWQGYGGGMHPNELPDSLATRVMTIGVTLYYRAPDEAEVSVKTKQGDFAFRLADVPASAPLHLLGSRVEVFRVPPVEPLTTEQYEDDYPAIAAAPDGAVTVAWVAYRNQADEIFVRTLRSGAWSSPERVTERPGDLFSVAAAYDGLGRLWIVWSERSAQNWQLKARSFGGGAWSGVETLTSGPGNNLFHRLVADKQGNLHLVWQSARRGRWDIYYRRRAGQSWSGEINLSDPAKEQRANDWSPDVAVDSRGTVWVAWDSYDGGSYNIRMRSIRDGVAGEVLRVTDTPRFHAHPSLAVDGLDRVWIAYDEAEENWGKDSGFLLTGGAGLYWSRQIRFAVWDGARWLQPRDDLSAVIRHTVRRYVQWPRLVADSRGRMWVFFRPRTSSTRPETVWAAGGKWEVMATYYSGDRWAAPVTLPESVARNEGPLAAVAAPDGDVYAAWVTDQRLWAGPAFGHPPRDNQVFVANVAEQFRRAPHAPIALGPRGSEPPARLPTEPQEKQQVASLRNYAISARGKTYRIYRGDLHRHTDISLDGAGDGSLFTAYRYMIDAAAMDFFLVTDHNSGNDQEYTWWRIEKSEDMFHVPGYFVTLFGYERSLPYPNGHRNVIYARRGFRTLPIGEEERKAEKNSGAILYPHLRRNGGIATSHTSHTGMGTDWRDNDPELEPIVEIFQGARTSAEHEGAPLAPSEKRTDLWAGGYRPLGFVWRAWEKGYKLGVQASSDHVSTHTSYAMVLAEAYTREGLVEAMRQRHTYAATSNILLDFRLRDGDAEYIHGDAYASASVPEIYVNILGTDEIQEVALIRDNRYIHTRPGNGPSLEFTFRETTLEPGEHYYYVRVQQRDRNMAWSSPIWIRYR
jgi:hypothetical protein